MSVVGDRAIPRTGLGAWAAVWLACGATGAGAAALDAAADKGVGTVLKRATSLCLSIHRAGLRAGTTVAVVVPDAAQPAGLAEITGRRNACAAEQGMSGYSLRLRQGTLMNGQVAAGILAPPSAVTLAGGSAAVALPGVPAPLRFRICTSADGVHVTGWNGAPLAGTRVWHRYVYLGQDLESTCTDKEAP